jgi:enterochelin esterase-like enzyme
MFMASEPAPQTQTATSLFQQEKIQKQLPAAPKGFDTRRDKIEHGKVETIEYDSKATGGKRKMTVYLPPGFKKDTKYPVFYLLHGGGDDETGWQQKGSADIILDNLYADKKIVPMIVVMPNGFAQAPGGKGGKNAAFEDDLLKDIIPYIESHYPVLAKPAQRALAGLSMGAGQSINIGLKNMDVFTWIGAFSGGGTLPAKLNDDPVSANNKLRLLWISCGDQDKLMKNSEAFHTALEAKKIAHVWHVDTGGHTWPVWKNDLYLFSQMLFREEFKLFDGKSLANWEKTKYGGEADVTVDKDKGLLVFEKGGPLTGVHWTGETLPRMNYELTLEAMRIEGTDFFCGIGFPVGDTSVSFVAGGWGGGICGISTVDGDPAADNQTATLQNFDNNKWYRFRLRVTPDKIEVWLDDNQIVDLEYKNHQIDIHIAMSLAVPFGLTSFETKCAYRNINLRRID